MPYNSNYKKKKYYKKSYQKRAYLSQGYANARSAIGTASRALMVAYGIKRLMNVEFKYHDVQLTTSTQDTTPIITQLSNIPQGDTDITRDGAQVKLTDIDIRYMITSHANALQTLVRIILVLDNQTNGAIYAATDLLQDVTVSDNIVSMLNLDNKYRFRVLYNKVIKLSNVGGNTSIFNKIHKKVNMKLRFESSTPSIADLNSKSLSLLMVSNQGANTPSVTLFSRIRYVDN